jgi:hypothetical protein
MKTPLTFAAALVLVAGLALAARPPQDAPADPMADAWAEAARYLALQPEHEWLAQFVGEWDTLMRIQMMPGAPAMESKGRCSTRWLHPGRWLISESAGEMMGMQVQTTTLLGYDAFKKKFVCTIVDSMNPYMLQAEGWRDRDPQVLNLWGPMDEYLTGEREKPVRYTWRIASPDRMVLEVHDLIIGEPGTKVVEIGFTRRK